MFERRYFTAESVDEYLEARTGKTSIMALTDQECGEMLVEVVHRDCMKAMSPVLRLVAGPEWAECKDEW